MNIINFSGGRTSAYMCKRLIDEGITDYIILFQNTGKEMPQTLDFINECDKRWSLGIVWIEYRFGNNFEVVNYETASRDGRPFSELIAHKNHFLPNQHIRNCTTQLKIETGRRYLQSIGIKEWTIINGIRYDEPRRWSKVKNLKSPAYVDYDLPLVKWKTNKQDVLNWWSKQDFNLKLKEPYGNCDLCFLKGVGKLMIIAKESPELFDWWIQHENNVVKNGITGTFKKGISYEQIRDKAQSQYSMFESDPSFECFCNTD